MGARKSEGAARIGVETRVSGRLYRGTAVTLALVLALVILPAAGASSALARGGGGSGIRILSPKEGARVTGETLVVRVRAKGRGFSALLGRRVVGPRFTRSGRFYTAVLRRGRDFGLGEGELQVGVGKRLSGPVDVVHFQALSRDDDTLALVELRKGRRARPIPLLHARTERRIESVRVRVNGKRVRQAFPVDGSGKGALIRLGAHSGLRFGRNRVDVEVMQRDGVFARETRRYPIPRDRPVAGTGKDRLTQVGELAPLDGSSTLLPGSAETAAYSWELVDQPEGSSAQLVNPTSVTAGLLPDVPGNYTAQLTVSGGAGSSVDFLELESTQALGPAGLPIQTITDDGGIQLGRDHYQRAGNWIRMLVLDSTSGAVIPQPPPPSGNGPDPNGWSTGQQFFSLGQGNDLLTAIKETSVNELVVLTGQGLPVSMSNSDMKNLTTAYQKLGGTLGAQLGPTPNGAADLASGNWSLIGKDGLPQGQAEQNLAAREAGIPGLTGLAGGDPGGPGSLNGYLQPLTGNSLRYVSPEAVPIDTKSNASIRPTDPPPATQNVMTVGSSEITSDTIPTGALGLQLVTLGESFDLPLMSNDTYVLNNADGSTNTDAVSSLVDNLVDVYNNQPRLILLQTFGNPPILGGPPNSPSALGVSPADSRFWVDDQLPSSEGNQDWYSNEYPNKPGQLYYSWNHDTPTVAGMIGQIAGVPSHDVVANFGGSKHVFIGGQYVQRPHYSGGLTMVANSHAYDPSSAVLQGQTDPIPSPGRLAGVLQRNRQGQWELESGSLQPGWQRQGQQLNLDVQSVYDIAFNTPSEPWPCSKGSPAPCSSAAAAAAANAYVACHVFPGTGIVDVRAGYVQKASEFEQGNAPMTNLAQTTYPPQAGDPCSPSDPSAFSQSDFDALKSQLGTEFPAVQNVLDGVEAWRNLFTFSGQAGVVDLSYAAAAVKRQLRIDGNSALARQKAEIDGNATTSDALYALSSIVDVGLAVNPELEAGLVPAALGGLGAGLALAEDLAPAATEDDPQQAVADDYQAIDAAIGDLGQSLNNQYKVVVATLGHFGDLFVSDPARLGLANKRFAGAWAFGSETKNNSVQMATTAAERSLYATIMPIPYRQWIISPRHTNRNRQGPEALPNNYVCGFVDHPSNPFYLRSWTVDGRDNPFQHAALSSLWAVRYGPPNQPGVTNITGRGLRSAIDTLTMQWADYDNHELGLTHKGAGAPQALTDMFFKPVAQAEPEPWAPQTLGMDQDVFFGWPSWTLKMMQCGHK